MSTNLHEKGHGRILDRIPRVNSGAPKETSSSLRNRELQAAALGDHRRDGGQSVAFLPSFRRKWRLARRIRRWLT
jgi:hypothetical protein